MKKIFFLTILLAVSATLAFSQQRTYSTVNTTSIGDTIINDTAQYWEFGRFNGQKSFTVQANHTKVSGFVKGTISLEGHSDNEASGSHRWVPIVGDTLTLANDDNTYHINVPVTNDLYYRLKYDPVDSTQTSALKVWITTGK